MSAHKTCSRLVEYDSLRLRVIVYVRLTSQVVPEDSITSLVLNGQDRRKPRKMPTQSENHYGQICL